MERICLNCNYWKPDVQYRGAANGIVCIRGQGHTNPDDSCSMFSPNYGVDSVLDPDAVNEKQNKMDVWKMRR